MKKMITRRNYPGQVLITLSSHDCYDDEAETSKTSDLANIVSAAPLTNAEKKQISQRHAREKEQAILDSKKQVQIEKANQRFFKDINEKDILYMEKRLDRQKRISESKQKDTHQRDLVLGFKTKA